jgi:membrane protein YqaA with SNARE-associated domain
MEEILTNFLVSVIASVVGSCVSKWLGRHRKGR